MAKSTRPDGMQELSIDACVMIDFGLRAILTTEEDSYARALAVGVNTDDEHMEHARKRIGTLKQLNALFAESPRVFVMTSSTKSGGKL